jgi:hypothetical protein
VKATRKLSGENLAKHCAIGLVACMGEVEAARKIQLMPLSDNTIQGGIQDGAVNMLDELFRILRLSESLTIQLDDCTDVVNPAVSVFFVWYIYEAEFEEDILFCKSTEK